jgi:hypothetical protein
MLKWIDGIKLYVLVDYAVVFSRSIQFQLLLAKASKLASSLGFGGQLRDDTTRAQLLKFVMEGLHFSFRRDNGEDDEAEETLHLGVRLPFLFLLSKCVYRNICFAFSDQSKDTGGILRTIHGLLRSLKKSSTNEKQSFVKMKNFAKLNPMEEKWRR